MSKAEKLLERFLSKPKDFTFEELRKLLKGLGYEEAKAGKTSGSRVAFYNRHYRKLPNRSTEARKIKVVRRLGLNFR